MTGINFRDILTTSEPEKKLTYGFKRAVGRNNVGRITMRHKGGGVKKLYRLVDFKYNKKDIPAIIKTIEYDPFRSGFISLVVYADGEKRYILLPVNLKPGEKIITSEKADIKPGNRLPMKNIPVGTFVYNVELKPCGGAKLIRSAGSYAEVAAQDKGFSLLKMPSGEVRKIPADAWASIGQVSNEDSKLINIGKAGRSRWLGIRPTVRGSAMNPVDHPYGGGEGAQGRGLRRAKTLWGKPSGKGQKTRNKKKYSKMLIISRRKKK
jgi:large subunit ribosomal protein L2